MSGAEVKSAVAGFSGLGISAVKNHVIVAAGSIDNEISEDDKIRALMSAQNIVLPPDKMIVQMIERQYIVDGYDGVKDPVGMSGGRLELDALILAAAAASLQNMHKSAERIDLNLERVVYNQLLAAESVLSKSEKDMGVVLIDIGSAITEISIFKNGTMDMTAVIPVGSDHITRDLAIVLKTTIDEAAKIKECGNIELLQQKEEDFNLPLQNIDGKHFNKRMIAEIMTARIGEMAEMIYAEIEKQNSLKTIPAGIVLTGGGANLYEIGEYFSALFKLPVRIGKPENINGLREEFIKPENSIVLGALMYQMHCTENPIKGNTFSFSQVFNRFNYWLRDILG